MQIKDPSRMTNEELVQRVCDLEALLVWQTSMLHKSYHKKPEEYKECGLPACKNAVELLTKGVE